MTQQIRLWRVGDGEQLQEVSGTDLELEARLEDWLTFDVSMIDEELLVIGRQVQTDFGGFIDLLCMDTEGDLVVVELKRARTSREITAQALDYASWVTEVDHERVREMANSYLNSFGGFEEAFKAKFDSVLPETLNGSHRIIIVGSEIDPATERIVQSLRGEGSA